MVDLWVMGFVNILILCNVCVDLYRQLFRYTTLKCGV
jgi:hypothetical protein